MKKFSAKPLLVVVALLSLSSVACAPSVQAPKAPDKPVKTASVTSPAPSCKDNGGTCIVDGTVDLVRRGYEAVKGQVEDPENQEAVSKAWESIKKGASDLYEKGKDAVQ